MKTDDLQFLRYMNADTHRFSFWITFNDLRKNTDQVGISGRRKLIAFFEQSLGPLGIRWQYSKFDSILFSSNIIIKLDHEVDATMMLLKYNRS